VLKAGEAVWTRRTAVCNKQAAFGLSVRIRGCPMALLHAVPISAILARSLRITPQRV
jgi:hypothetical protein